MNADKWTDKELAKLEKRIEKEYQNAYYSLLIKLHKYMEGYTVDGFHYNGLRDRFNTQYEAYQDGFYTEQQFRAWVYAQEGRGQHWVRMVNQMAEKLTKASKVSADYVNAVLPSIYTVNSNELASIATKSALEQGVVGIKFDLIDERMVKRLMEGSSEVAPYRRVAIDLPREYSWELNRLNNCLLQGVLQGETIDKIADRMESSFYGVTKNARASAIRSARTAITGAQNGAKSDRYEELQKKGCEVMKIWRCVGDDRTRDAHYEADGQTVNSDEPFLVGGELLMHPADTSLGASGWNVFNCRCGMESKITFKSIRSEYSQNIDSIDIVDGNKANTTEKSKELTNRRLERMAEINRKREIQPKEKQANFNEMSRKQLIDYANNQLKTNFEGFNGANEDFIRSAVASIDKFEKLNGGTVGNLSVKFGGTGSNVFAKYDDTTNTILLKKTGSIKAFEEKQRKTNEMYHVKWKTQKDYHATETYSGTIFHELGHAIDFSTGQRLSKELEKSTELELKAVKISVYAGDTQNIRTSKRSEAWAENFAVYMDGGRNRDKLAKEIEAMIEDYFKKGRI